MKTLKLVGAQTYVGPRTKNVVLNKGDIFEFEDKDAEAVLKEVTVDSNNNEHPLFVEADEQEQEQAAGAAADEEGGNNDAPPAPKKAVSKRARAA